MNDRQLHPVQQQYLDTKDKIEALEVAMLPLKNEMKLLRKQLKEAEGQLVAWLKRHFPDSYDMMGNYARVDMALHIDASTVPPDEPEPDDVNK